VIVADTGAILALIDRGDRHHKALKAIYDAGPDAWLLPWAILPEVDYLLASRVSPKAQDTFLGDLADGAFQVEWGDEGDLVRARELCDQHRALQLGLVDGVVTAVAERIHAEAIATLDLRHFGAIAIEGRPRLLPRDLPEAAAVAPGFGRLRTRLRRPDEAYEAKSGGPTKREGRRRSALRFKR